MEIEVLEHALSADEIIQSSELENIENKIEYSADKIEHSTDKVEPADRNSLFLSHDEENAVLASPFPRPIEVDIALGTILDIALIPEPEVEEKKGPEESGPFAKEYVLFAGKLAEALSKALPSESITRPCWAFYAALLRILRACRRLRAADELVVKPVDSNVQDAINSLRKSLCAVERALLVPIQENGVIKYQANSALGPSRLVAIASALGEQIAEVGPLFEKAALETAYKHEAAVCLLLLRAVTDDMK